MFVCWEGHLNAISEFQTTIERWGPNQREGPPQNNKIYRYYLLYHNKFHIKKSTNDSTTNNKKCHKSRWRQSIQQKTKPTRKRLIRSCLRIIQSNLVLEWCHSNQLTYLTYPYPKWKKNDAVYLLFLSPRTTATGCFSICSPSKDLLPYAAKIYINTSCSVVFPLRRAMYTEGIEERNGGAAQTIHT